MRSRPKGSRWWSSSRFLTDWCPLMRRLKWRQRRRQGISPLREPRMEPSCVAPKAVPSTNEAAAGATVLQSAAAVRGRCAIVSEAARRDDGPETARARIDLAVVSVLLDAGTGPDWRYHDAETGQVLSRSEGLAVASLRAMQAGIFSADPSNPWRADAEALLEITPQKLADALQHTDRNELVGLEGRALMMRRLGEACAASPTLFGVPARLGGLYDHWSARGEALPAAEILATLLQGFGT